MTSNVRAAFLDSELLDQASSTSSQAMRGPLAVIGISG